MRHVLALFLCLCLPSAAHAKWFEASSAHFVIYADEGPDMLRLYAQRLESFDAAMASVTNVKLPTPSPSSRVTVYFVKDAKAVRKLLGDDERKFIGAFYVPRIEGSIAIVPSLWSPEGDVAEAMLPLLHEYAHHFTLSSGGYSPPRWLAEGGAEFFASAGFKGGDVMLGRPAVHRGWELFNSRDVTVHDLFDPAAYEKKRNANVYDAYYGKSWLLYHYLTATQKRPGQMGAYLRALMTGKDEVEAARTAFGDFDVLERELDSYQRSRGMMMIKVPKAGIEVGPISVRPLSAGEAEMMPVRIRSKRGVNQEQASALLVEARAIAVRNQADGAVQAALAEAEYDAGNDAEAIAAADAAIARDPQQKNAYVQKGYALFRRAYDAKDKTAAYNEALKPFLALNAIENDHPLPLLYFYLSYLRQGKTPTRTATDALAQAIGLAPFDFRLRQLWVVQLLNDGRLADARRALEPLAYNPHAPAGDNRARQMMDQIDAGTVPKRILTRDQFPGQPDSAFGAGPETGAN